LILGDHIFYGYGLGSLLRAAADTTDGGSIFSCEVANPSAFGIVTFDAAESLFRSRKSRPIPPRITP
jgi:glucose-1-phosphate thymidylyltransferase